MQGVKSVYYVSPQEAEALFRAELPGRTDLLEVMGTDFRLPSSLQIAFDREAMDTGRISEISRAIGAIEGVEEAVYGEDYLPGLIKTVTTIRRLVLLLGIVLVSSISLVVFYTVRLSVVRRSLTVELMRIVGGRWAGVDLVSPGQRVRPTKEEIRSELFDTLEPDLAGAKVLDLFAGTGALGLEALSRGAADCVFVEKSPKAAQTLRANIATLQAENAVVYATSAVKFLQQGSAAAFARSKSIAVPCASARACA